MHGDPDRIARIVFDVVDVHLPIVENTGRVVVGALHRDGNGRTRAEQQTERQSRHPDCILNL